MWGLASFAFGAIDDELPNDQLFIREQVRVLDLDCFSEKVLLTEEFDPGSD